MKRNLLLVAALFCSVAMSAQSTWSCITTCSADGKSVEGTVNLKGTTTASNIAMSDITWGAGVKAPTTTQKTFKDAGGTAYNFVSDTEALIKWVPTTINGGDDPTIKELAPAYAAGQYVEFAMEINNLTDVFNLEALKLDAVRLGTDAVRMNVKLLGTDVDEMEYDSGWLITADNWSAISGGIGSWTDGEVAEGEVIPGYQPSREDGSKPNSSADKGCSSLNIPLSIGKDLYKVKAHVVFYGIADNKALALRNVSFVSKGEGTGIQDNVSVDESVAAKYYTISGVEVQEPVKGINIVKRTMTDGSVKYSKEIK